MIVKVAGKVFDSANVPIMIIFSEEEKNRMKSIENNEFIVLTPRMSEEEIFNFTKHT